MRGTFIAFGVAAALATVAACDDGSPTFPNAVQPSGIPTTSLTGVVSEPVGVAVEAATVTVADGPYKGKSTVTYRDGSYALIGVEGGFTVQVTKEGYESVARGVTVPPARTLDVEIRPLSITGDISGNWNITFQPNPGCPGALAGARTYRASIVQHGADLSIGLSGATFVKPPQLSGTIRDLSVSINLPDGCNYYCYYYGPSSPPEVIERLDGNQFLAISGQITATVTRLSIVGGLNGSFALMRSPTPPFDFLATCSGVSHRVTFTR